MAGNNDLCSEKQLADLIDRCNQGDSLALRELEKLLDEYPSIWREAGDVAKFAQEQMIELIANGNRFVAECVCRRLDEQRAELLAGQNGGPIYQLAVDWVLACRLELELLQAKFPDPTLAGAGRAKVILKWAKNAQKRYSAALKSLATVDRLLGNENATIPRGPLHRRPSEPLRPMDAPSRRSPPAR